jgi:hypothetical protein
MLDLVVECCRGSALFAFVQWDYLGIAPANGFRKFPLISFETSITPYRLIYRNTSETTYVTYYQTRVST